MARENSSKGGDSEKENPGKLLWDKLSLEEANAVLRALLKSHPELQQEADILARNIAGSPSIEETADEVLRAVSGVDLDALNKRSGSHSWGYVEPSEAARELLEESLGHLIDNMKRQADLGLSDGAEAICGGIVEGLYRARNANSDGALGWAPDFPIEQAGQVLQEFFRSSASAAKLIASRPFLESLATRAPEWTDMLRRVMNQPATK